MLKKGEISVKTWREIPSTTGTLDTVERISHLDDAFSEISKPSRRSKTAAKRSGENGKAKKI